MPEFLIDIYVALPYSSPSPAVRQRRFDCANAYTAALLRNGQIAFSPISHSHPIAPHGLPTSWEFWRKFDTPFLEMSASLHVLCLPRWQQSVGLTAEIAFMRHHSRPITFIHRYLSFWPLT